MLNNSAGVHSWRLKILTEVLKYLKYHEINLLPFQIQMLYSYLYLADTFIVCKYVARNLTTLKDWQVIYYFLFVINDNYRLING